VGGTPVLSVVMALVAGGQLSGLLAFFFLPRKKSCGHLPRAFFFSSGKRVTLIGRVLPSVLGCASRFSVRVESWTSRFLLGNLSLPLRGRPESFRRMGANSRVSFGFPPPGNITLSLLKDLLGISQAGPVGLPSPGAFLELVQTLLAALPVFPPQCFHSPFSVSSPLGVGPDGLEG